MNLQTQKGAVMLEAAYVLPLMMAVILMVVEVVNYSLESLRLNDVMADTYKVIMSQADQLHTDPTLTSLAYVKCMANKVVPNEAVVSSALTSSIAKAISADGATSPTGLQISVVSGTTSGVLSYVVKVNYPSQTSLLPESLAQSFPIKAQGVFSFDLSC